MVPASKTGVLQLQAHRLANSRRCVETSFTDQKVRVRQTTKHCGRLVEGVDSVRSHPPLSASLTPLHRVGEQLRIMTHSRARVIIPLMMLRKSSIISQDMHSSWSQSTTALLLANHSPLIRSQPHRRGLQIRFGERDFPETSNLL